MSISQQFLAANLRYLMDKRGLNPNSLSDQIGNKPPQATIFRILNGESLTPRDGTLEPLAAFFGVPVHALRYEDLTKGTSYVAPQIAKRLAEQLAKARIFVVRLDHGGLPGQMWDDEGLLMNASEDYATIATDDDRAFLVPVFDNSLSPRYQAGEYALVEPSVTPEIEDDVLVRLKSGSVLLRRLVSTRAGIKLGTYSSVETTTLAEDEISWMFYVSNPVPRRKIQTLKTK
jgi:transcriptional regulator with XRE-family HTH domain